MRSIKSVLGQLAAVSLVLVAVALPAMGGGALVTGGSFQTFAVGLERGYEITGHAQMVRTPSGKTIVTVNAKGLVPGQTYGSHVHMKACDDLNAGGHYSFGHPVHGGAYTDGSEIWPGPFTANPAGNVTGWTMVKEAAGLGAVAVVIHAPDGQKIACADLG